MSFFLFLVSVVLIIKGVIMIMAPKKAVKIAENFLKTKDIKPWGIVPLIVGIFLLFSASSSTLPWLIVLLGLALMGKAVYLFLTPASKIRSLAWFSLSDNGHRAIGILLLVLGVIVLISKV